MPKAFVWGGAGSCSVGYWEHASCPITLLFGRRGHRGNVIKAHLTPVVTDTHGSSTPPGRSNNEERHLTQGRYSSRPKQTQQNWSHDGRIQHTRVHKNVGGGGWGLCKGGPKAPISRALFGDSYKGEEWKLKNDEYERGHGNKTTCTTLMHSTSPVINHHKACIRVYYGVH